MTLNKENLIGLKSRIRADFEKIYVEAWDTDVCVKKFSAKRFNDLLKKAEGNDTLMTYSLIAESIVDDEGTRIFDNEEEMAWLEEMDFKTLEELNAIVISVNGLSKKTEQEAEKNSEAVVS